MKSQKGFIQIPLLVIVIVSIIVASVGTGVVLQKQEKLAPFIANISEMFKGTEGTTIIQEKAVKSEEPQVEQEPEPKEEEIVQEAKKAETQAEEAQIRAEQAELEAENLKQQAEAAKEEVEKARLLAEAEKTKAEAEKAKAEAERLRKEAEEAERLIQEKLLEISSCEGIECPSCQYCIEGKCLNRPDGYNDCGSGCQRCINGSCQNHNAACPNCQYCSSDTCVNYCEGTNTSCGCTNCANCNNLDGWVDMGVPYSCCDGDKACTCQKQEYRDYSCLGASCNSIVTNTRVNKSNCAECSSSESCLNGACQSNCAGTDTSCGSISCINCNNSDGCSGNSYLDYYCSGTSCIYTSDDCSDCSCSCGGYNIEESIANGNCSDGKDNDCDGYTDSVDSGCIAQSSDITGEFITLTSPLGGNITQNSKLTLANSPYIVTETVQVLEGVTLEIEPGVIIKFKPTTALIIGGTLKAIGTEEQKIVLTSSQDNPRARNWIGDTAANDWGGISFLGKSKDAVVDNNNYVSGNIIKHSIIQYAFTGLSLGQQLDPVKVFISNNIIRDNYKGIYVSGNSVIINNMIDNNSETGVAISGGNPILSHNEITNNTIRVADLPDFDRWDFAAIKFSTGEGLISKNIIKNNARGFSFWFNANPLIQYNNIYDNQNRNIKMAQNSDIRATNNYWGTTDLSIIDTMIHDYYDNIGLGKILYQPIATSEIPDAGVQ